jgi:hypothetical protein
MRKDQKQIGAERKRSRVHVTQADLGRVATFLETMGAKIAEVDVLPGRMKILTTEGRAFSVEPNEDELDRELMQYRRGRGEGTS